MDTLVSHSAGKCPRPDVGARNCRTEGAEVLPGERASGPVPRGQRVFTAGHSFHVFVAEVLPGLAESAGLVGHVNLGTQFLGGSRVIEHWDRPEPANAAKRTLRTGRVDVLTLSPTFHPDPGIDRFARLALQYNPGIRITVQASWVPFDTFIAAHLHARPASRDTWTGDDLWQLHAPYFQSLNEEIRTLNGAYGKPVLFAVPIGQALIALRERIRAGRAPRLRSQEELFTDPLGHPALPVQLLAAYGHFAVIYRRSPVGLPLPALPAQAESRRIGEELHHLLQELAWEAVIQHPLSGVAAGSPSPNRA